MGAATNATGGREESTTPEAARLVDGVFVSAEGVPLAFWWDEASTPYGALRLVDQTRLPVDYRVLTCEDQQSVETAIRTLQVRGAPAIGVAAAFGLALGARATFGRQGTLESAPPESALARVDDLAAALRATRPTAVNLA